MRRWKPTYSLLLVSFCIQLAGGRLFANSPSTVPLDDSNESKYGFIDQKKNVLQGNMELLKPFYERLYQLKLSPGRKQPPLGIFHLGDSHLQAGFLNGTVMLNFHRDFGNAGRGLILPLKLANTNEPGDYDISSRTSWRTSRCTSSRMPFQVGIGGLGLRSLSQPFNWEIKLSRSRSEAYKFNKIRLYHHRGAPSPVISAASQVVSTRQPEEFVTVYELDKLVDVANLEGNAAGGADSAIYYGVSLENGRNGILYHAVGLNGAQFLHYMRIDGFADQIRSLEPELIIFSLGCNEAFRGNIRESQILREIKSLVGGICEKNPQAVIILTTPAECQNKRVQNGKTVYEPNTYVGVVRNAIVTYAHEMNYIYWDLYDIAGGSGSSESWVKANLLARDRVHFEIPGYRVQGNLLYQAIIKGYNDYVSIRNK